MRKYSFLIGVAVVGAVILVGYLLAHPRVGGSETILSSPTAQNVSLPLGPSPSSLETPGADLLDMGYVVKSTSSQPRITREAAIRAARGVPAAAPAQSVFATLIQLSSRPGTSVDATQLVGRPLWLITVQGVTIHRHGGSGLRGTAPAIETSTDPTAHHELNVLVDASSGDIVEMFSYR